MADFALGEMSIVPSPTGLYRQGFFYSKCFKTAQTNCLLFARLTEIQFKIKRMLLKKYRKNVLLSAQIRVYTCTSSFTTAEFLQSCIF